jgi:hypothetical protein
MAKNKSVEEQVEDKAKAWLAKYKLKTFSKTQSINSEIDDALKNAPSKSGGSGGNYPDIRLLLSTKTKKKFPIVIEVKGTRGKLVKLNAQGEVENFTAKGERNYSNINSFAVNGAVHYANAILDFTKSYKEVIAIGINGYQETDNTLKIEIGVYYVSKDNLYLAKKVDVDSDLSFLAPSNFDDFIGKVEQLKLSPEEVDSQRHNIEVRMETGLKNLNQSMHDDLRISVGARVPLIAGMIMAGLGVPGKVAPLDVPDLKGETGENNNDGNIIINKIRDFLGKLKLPQEKKNMIVNDLTGIFLNSDLYTPKNEESKLKTVYARVRAEILPIFTMPKHHLDFTGRLFNVLNEWVDIPDGERNDVVLTPRYVTKMMAQLAKVDKDSFVWDYAAGSAGFLISSMKLMIEDAENKIKSPAKLEQKKSEIKFKQLLGIEKRLDIYMLAVLNMILMDDGSANILHKDSLTEYNGMYEQGDEKGKPFPANVFLLNPPYSAEGKGFIFVKRALERMSGGRAVILIQENAGSGNGLPYTKELLQKHTLLASIHMADIFCGKAGVQTAVYVFEVGKAHNKKQIVRFIDMSNDGYSRQNRKRSGLDVNLRNIGNANERYQEVVDLVNYGKTYLKYFTEKEYIEDTITLDGDDWTFSQHKKINAIPTETDFMKVVSDYLAWEVGRVLKGEIEDSVGETETSLKKNLKTEYKKFQIGYLFDIHPTKSYGLTNSKLFETTGKTPVIVNSSRDNGVGGYVDLEPTEKGNIITFSDTTTADSIFYQPDDFIGYSHVQGVYPKQPNKWSKEALLYFVINFRKVTAGRFDYATKFNRKIAIELKISLPVTSGGDIDFAYMENYIRELEAVRIRELEAYLQVTGLSNYNLTDEDLQITHGGGGGV